MLTVRPNQWCGALALFAALFAASVALAQDEKESELPEPEDFQLTTRDGVVLHGTYYASERGKKAPVLVMLHELGGDRRDYEGLALLLQKAGHACVAIDLRGHGDSTTVVGTSRKLNWQDFRTPAPFALMVTNDMEAVKSYLVEGNNKGEFNINKTCVVGARMGAAIGITWTQADWSAPTLLTVGKQGQDVRGLILLSPSFNVNGFNISPAMRFLRSNKAIAQQISVQIHVGGRSTGGRNTELADAKRIFNMLKPFHKVEVEKDEDYKHKSLWYHVYEETSLQGTKLLKSDRKLIADRRQLEEWILAFLHIRLVEKDFPWAVRKRPFEN